MNSIEEGLKIREEALGAYISLLGKEGKDPTLCSSFRTISLINEDVKIYARILAKRLRPFMSDCIKKIKQALSPGGRQGTIY